MKQVAQQFVMQKLKQLTVHDLMAYGKQYKIPISKSEAELIVKALRKNKENPFDPNGRKRMLNKLAAITSKDTARSVNHLLMELAKEHGVAHWLK
ncbi:Protein of unknown function [Halobacillus alkaliphilus]|uniref:DUF2624 domain-containing protein n=1 Tax=Halobacillus alkaliphilus TaxID=396056 RepID=A0A1I2JLU0_9BACI|nr:DUF2624 domain-containing protein [Halobacillus alkaliphilus]SFF53766.1 Protein of unknown function [Halobacillus alkaliphilus]